MNFVKNRTLHPHLRDEEIVLVENAIRLAIDSIVNVMCGVDGARTREYQRTVAHRDKEIQRLEGRLGEIEHELQVLRRQGCTCELFGNEHSLLGSQASGDRRGGEQRGFEPGCMDAEVTAGLQECDMSISLGLFARPRSHVSSRSHGSAPPSSPSRMCLDQACTPHSSEASGVSEAARNPPASPSSLVVKEEPCDIDAVLIKWEMSEERFGKHQECTGSPCRDEEGLAVKKKQENREREGFREELQADPGRHQMTEGEHLRNKKKGVPMSELPEEAQRLKRAAWRAASRRYYARKIARQQPHPSHHPDPLPHISASQYSPPLSFMDQRQTLISHLPEESQVLQREAWKAASRRYYARKVIRQHVDPAQYGHLLQNAEPSGETREPNRAGSHTNSEGITCS